MDDKANRRNQSGRYGRRRKQAKDYKRALSQFLQSHKSAVFTSILLFLIIILLFGVSSQLQPPVTNSAPNGETVVDYTTFMQQVKTGNVLAVVLQDNDISGLLARPLGQHNTPLKTPLSDKSAASDYAVWSRSITAGTSLLNLPGGQAIDPDRLFYTHIPSNGDVSLMPTLVANHVKVNTLPAAQSMNWSVLFWRFLPVIFLVVMVLVLLATRSNSQSPRPIDTRMLQMGKSRARRLGQAKEASSTETQKFAPAAKTGQVGKPTVKVQVAPPVTFADVAGIDEVRAELEEIVQFLREPDRFKRLGARIPRGALLVGPPGTGKTLLAKAVAGEAGVPFFSISASEFVEMFVGVGASRVRDLFNQARQSAPSVIFIDEIDAVGRKRSMRATNNDERDQTLNQLLVELDGFDARHAVVVMAATNRADILDKALLRPGRFDRRITVSVPDRVGREAILKVHTRQVPLHEDVNLERLSRMTTGMSGADLANLVNEAALSAARSGLEHVDHECFELALARVQLGALRPIVMSEKERRIIAIHEGGHALVAYHLSEADTVNRVTILPRGQSLGVTQFTAEEDRYNYSRQTLMARIAVGLGGRVAEELTFGPEQITTGAENDLQVVTDLARRMVTRWGMSEQVGVVFADSRAEGDYALTMRRIDPDMLPSSAHSLVANTDGSLHMNGNLPEQTFALSMPTPHSSNGVMMNALIDAEVQRILNEGRAMARALLSEHNDQLRLLADALMQHEQLDRNQFETLLKE